MNDNNNIASFSKLECYEPPVVRPGRRRLIPAAISRPVRTLWRQLTPFAWACLFIIAMLGTAWLALIYVSAVVP